MDNHYKSLLEYNHEANQKFIEKAFSSRQDKIISQLSHILHTHYAWNERMLQRSRVIDTWKVIPVADLYEKNENNLIGSMSILKKFSLNSTIEYRNFKNERFFNKTFEIFFHIVNHSSYHRGMIFHLFEQEGIEGPNSDYIFYQRSTTKS